jgi:hypothetical protein
MAGELESTFTRAELEAGVKLTTGQPHLIRVGSRSQVARVLGKAFSKNKSFLVPGTLTGLKRVRALLQKLVERSPRNVLVVGHCDTTGDDAVNDPLSLERATNTIAYLVDDPEPWLKMYTTEVPFVRRWGEEEDAAMLSTALGDIDPPPADPVREFQSSRGLQVDGIAGPVTRRQLIVEYMQRDDPPFSELALDVKFTPHGCGEHFPLDESGRKVDSARPDNKDDPLDRRVEFYVFPRKPGIVPPPPGPNSEADSPQYPDWRKSSRVEFETVIAEGEDDFFLRFDIAPSERKDFTDKLRLFSSDGAYDQVRTLAEDGLPQFDFVDVVFTRVQIALSYSLEVTPEVGDAFFLFEDVPFANLNGLTDPETEFEDPDPLEPEPDNT